MNEPINRREFLQRSAGTAALALANAAQAKTMQNKSTPMPKKSLIYSMLPGGLKPEDRMKLARDCGFEGIQIEPVTDANEAKALRATAEKVGIPLQSVI